MAHRHAETNNRAWLEGLSLLLCAAILIWQLRLPGFIGMADNGDFAKVAGRFCLADADRETEKFSYFQPDFVRGPASCYNPHIPSSEFVPARMAATLVRTLGNKTHFDIRWLGGLHALIFIGVYYLLLLLLRPLDLVSRIILSLTALWIFADVGFVAYLNTFYSDVPAMLGGLAAIFLAVLLARSERTNAGLLTLFGLAALFFVTSKAQHGILRHHPDRGSDLVRVAGTRFARAVGCGTGGSGIMRGNDLGDRQHAGLVYGAIQIQSDLSQDRQNIEDSGAGHARTGPRRRRRALRGHERVCAG
jgi:hypothetical protein